MKKNRNKLSKYKVLLRCVFVCLLFIFGIAIGRLINANAEEESLYITSSDDISYDNTQTGINANNAEEVLNYLYTQVGQCPEGYTCTKKSVENVLKYDENSSSSTYCVTGNESTCVADTCVDNGTTCQAGTIVNYKVNATETVRFHVLHDNGNTITMQTQKNIVHGTAWNSSNSISGGPITIMGALKTATSTWTTTKDITFANGMSTYSADGISAINKCSSYNSCSGSLYQYSTIVNTIGNNGVMKARLITEQEAYGNGGCTTSDGSCKKFMYNYTYNCSGYGCTVASNNAGDYGYWTMAANSSSNAWLVYYRGHVRSYNPSNTGNGARAVVVVDK